MDNDGVTRKSHKKFQLSQQLGKIFTAKQCRNKANAGKFLKFQAADIRISLPLSKKYGEY